MRKKAAVILVIICIILLGIFYLRPYNYVEFNCATIYYQSYSQLHRNIGKYVDMLENYSKTEEKAYLEKAKMRLENIIDSLII